MKRLDAIQNMNPIIKQIRDTDGLVKRIGQTLELRPCNLPNMIRCLRQPAEDQLGRQLVGAISMLLQILVFFERQQYSKECRLRQVRS